jgi:predicted MPP superfamily phosphohydrolase
MRVKFLLFVLLVFCVVSTSLAQSVVKGYVFIDKNKNGVKDAGEQGLKDVIVSNQVITTKTDAQGFYQIDNVSHLGYIFVVNPEGFKLSNNFWRKISEGREDAVDFPLEPINKVSRFTFIHASDPHISEASVNRIRQLKTLVDSLKPAFVLMTGDLIKDALRVGEKEASAWYELYKSEIDKFSVPVFGIPGNHEIFGIERHSSLVPVSHPLYGKKMYRHFLGPDYYSFNYGGVHFIGLNTVDYHDLWYYGHIDSLQLRWLDRDLQSVNRQTPVVTFNHIPFYTGGLSLWGYQDEEPGSSLIQINGKKTFRHVVDNAHDVITRLNQQVFPLALSGHYHFSQQFTFDSEIQKTRFYQAGAIVAPGNSGGFVMPSGITLYTVENGVIDNGKFVKLK